VEALFRASGALREGHFQLKSGRHGTSYLEKSRVLQHPAAVCELLGISPRPSPMPMAARPSTSWWARPPAA
jgi:hypothetical protein